jgi:Anti-sigma-K factor rskA
MIPSTPPSIDRLYDLLATQATQPLTTAEANELRLLQTKWPHIEADELELAAAAIVAATATPSEPLAPELLARLQHDADRHFGIVELRTPSVAPPKRSWSNWLGWMVAACLLTTTSLLGWQLMQSDRSPLSLVQLRQDLLARGATRFVSADQRSEAIWDGATQRGVMRLTGLPTNDPTQSQYQLWIVDAGRSQPEPVDGGVFDVSKGEALIPIKAVLAVRSPKAFAITTESPGGVVVSDRGRRGEFVAVMTTQ